MTSSRCESPTRKKWNVPLWMPIDIRSATLPADVSMGPMSRSAFRMPTAARAPLAGWSSSEKKSSSASPPNFTSPPPCTVGDGQEASEDRTDDIGDLLGPDLPLPGEALGHLREPGDVDEHDRALQRSQHGAGRLRQPADQEVGQVGTKPGGVIDRGFGHAATSGENDAPPESIRGAVSRRKGLLSSLTTTFPHIPLHTPFTRDEWNWQRNLKVPACANRWFSTWPEARDLVEVPSAAVGRHRVAVADGLPPDPVARRDANGGRRPMGRDGLHGLGVTRESVTGP